MSEEIYIWMEEQSGVTYDLTDDIQELSGDFIFTNTHAWKSNMHFVLNKLSEAIDVIDENYRNLREDLPSRDELKKLFTAEVLGSLVSIINSIKQKLNIDTADITSVNQLYSNIEVLYDIVEELRTSTVEEVLQSSWYDDYNDENDDILSTVYGIHKNDLPNMHYTIQSIIDLHEDDED